MIKVNKHKITIIFFSILIVIGALLYFKVYYQASDLKYSQEYVVGQNNIKGSVDIDYFLDRGKEFEIGANKYGYAVLKNPKEAFKKLKADYKDGLRIIRKEFNLLPINQLNYKYMEPMDGKLLLVQKKK